jgi:hypothetical protein
VTMALATPPDDYDDDAMPTPSSTTTPLMVS